MSVPVVEVRPPLSPAVYGRRPAERLPFPFGEPGCALFARLQDGLLHGIRALGLASGDEVLVPVYHDGCEIEALRLAGLECRFYDVDERLAPRPSALAALVTPRTRALYLTHHLGFPQDAPRWRAWCDERGLLLIEDASQAWLASVGGRPAGAFGDLGLFCLWRSFGVPDGAAILLPVSETVAPERPRSSGVMSLAGRHAGWLMARMPWAAELGAHLPRPGGGNGVAVDDDQAPGPSSATLRLLPRVVDVAAAARRRANFELLLAELGDLVPDAFRELPAGAAPLAFPVEIARKEELVERLRRQRIHVLDPWPRPHPLLGDADFPEAAARRARLIGLPVHQELRPADVKRVARVVRGRTAAAPPLTLLTLETLEAFADEWDELAVQRRNLFATREWLSTWWRHFGGDRPLRIVACRDADGRLVAILPLYISSGPPVRIVRFLGHGPGDQLGPICAPRDRAAAATALRRWLALPHHPPYVLIGEQLPGDEGWGALLGGRTLRREGNPEMRFHGRSWDELLASMSYKLRQEVRSHERKLARNHDVRYRLADDPERLDADLDILFDLHRRQWVDGTSAFLGPREAFHREFAHRAHARGWLRLWFLEVDGQPVAAKYNFRFAGVEFSYQAGRDPAWKRSSPGFVILTRAMRGALEEGAENYRFLRGAEAYKYRFANADPGLETVALSPGVVTAAAVAGGAMLRDTSRLGALRQWLRT